MDVERLRSALAAPARALFDALLAHASLAADGDDLVASWPERDPEDALRIFAPNRALDADALPSLRGLFAACGGLEVGEQGTFDQLVLHDGTAGTLATVGDDAWNDRFPFAWTDVRCAPIDLHLQAFYVVDPRDGALWFRDEGTLERVRDTRDVVEIYLREVCLRLQRYPATTAFDRAVAAVPRRIEWVG